MKTSAFIFLISFILLFGCKEVENDTCGAEEEKVITGTKITDNEAKILIKNWIFEDFNPDMNPSIDFTVKELTTDETWEKSGIQVFELEGDFPLAEMAVAIEDSNVYHLGASYWDQVIESGSMVVADLDKDNINELYYPLTFGSGILRTIIGGYSSSWNKKTLNSEIRFMFPTNYEITLMKDNCKVFVKYNDSSTDIKIGELKIDESGNEYILTIAFEDNIPDSVMKVVGGLD